MIKYYHRFFEVDDRFSDKVIAVRIIFFLILIGMVICLAVALYQEMVSKQVITPLCMMHKKTAYQRSPEVMKQTVRWHPSGLQVRGVLQKH